jgi:hypothetical protein
VNLEVRGEYERETEKAADFRVLLTARYGGKYKELKGVRDRKEATIIELSGVRNKLRELGIFCD